MNVFRIEKRKYEIYSLTIKCFRSRFFLLFLVVTKIIMKFRPLRYMLDAHNLTNYTSTPRLATYQLCHTDELVIVNDQLQTIIEVYNQARETNMLKVY